MINASNEGICVEFKEKTSFKTNQLNIIIDGFSI